MGDVLAGFQTVWEFDTDSILIRFERGIRTPKLLQALGERRIPFEALAGVELGVGKRGTVVLRAVPRPGADPLMDAAAGQLKEAYDPYRLVLPAERETLADYYAELIRESLLPDADTAAEAHLVAAPAPPLSFKAYDGKASFDGKDISFRWFWTGASSEKWKVGDQRFRIDELTGVEWRSPESRGSAGTVPKEGSAKDGAANGGAAKIGTARNGTGKVSPKGGGHGYLRLLRRAAEDQPAERPDRDPAAVVFGMGYGLVHQSLPFAAAVLEAIRASSPVPCAEGAPAPNRAAAPRRDPADIAERIRHLGELHTAGLLTDDEFSAKKAELLAEL
ncbi:hypothetical protein VT50_0222750 [Streptomyces antioxidans]|uniref:DUF4429 domain-containing protein n=1 Tax=Streptomyces antioxidans TaxID=1507734 RepID=A0A1V4D1Y4_9ACTN|nr:DUF4429 domain-containing protein [Streptomyces antioxidans]OPF76819.1 hypothetical protein VT50_0222750 [Streptomyces antioxidans]